MENSASICETLKNPWRGQLSLLGSLCMFRETNTNKVSISDYTFNFVFLVPTGVENNAYAKFWRANKVHYRRCTRGVDQ